MSLSQWKQRVAISKQDAMVMYNTNEYELFVHHLAYPTQSRQTPFSISIIVRMINHFIDHRASLSSILCKKHTQLLDSLKLTAPIISLNPVSGNIYMADEYNIYYVHETDQDNTTNDKKLKKAVTMPDHDTINKDKQMNNISFNSDGNCLFALMNDNLDKVYYIDLLHAKIFCDKIYDKSMDIARYDFNCFYLTSKWLPQFFLEVVNTIIPSKYRSVCIEDETNQNSLYRLDPYRKYLWLLQNNSIDQEASDIEARYGNNDGAVYRVEPLLYRIPIQYANMLKQIKKLNMDRISLHRRNGSGLINDSSDFTNKQRILEHELQEISKKGEIINLKQILKLKDNRFIKAFDIDRYFEAIYAITNDDILYRIEQDNTFNVEYKEIVRRKAKNCISKASPRSIRQETEVHINEFNINTGWKVTHKVHLNKALKDGLPTGKCVYCYDSVNGRLIVADNYKIQSLYI